MRALTHKPKAPHQDTSAKSRMPSSVYSGQSFAVSTRPYLQYTVGNQALHRMSQSNAEELEVGLIRPTSCGFVRDFSHVPVQAKSSAILQAKEMVNPADDIYEQEADRISSEVMHMPEPQLQRVCACSGACSKCRTERLGSENERVQAKRFQSYELGRIEAPPFIHEVLASSGQSLDMATRSPMEQRFGYDFSGIRLIRKQKQRRQLGQSRLGHIL